MGVPVEDARPELVHQVVQDSRLVQDNAGRPADDRYSMEQDVGVVGRRLVHALNKTKT